jgi:hypothetical protein
MKIKAGFLKFSKYIFIMAILAFACKDQDVFQDVPYYRQGQDSNCYQACLLMILKNFFPEENYILRDMDKLTGRKPSHWTFEAQLVPPLLDKGLDVRLFATTDYEKINEEYVSRRYGQHVVSLIDYGAVRRAAARLTPAVHSRRRLEWKDVEELFRNGWLTMLCVDENALWTGEAGRFSGHALMLVGISGHTVYIHDPRKGPNLSLPKKNLVKAWQVEGTDTAVLFVKHP